MHCLEFSKESELIQCLVATSTQRYLLGLYLARCRKRNLAPARPLRTKPTNSQIPLTATNSGHQAAVKQTAEPFAFRRH